MRDELSAITPRLRRYARALVAGEAGVSDVSDALVHATLMRAMGARGVGGAADLPIRLYATVTQLHRDLAPVERSEVAAGAGRRVAANLILAAEPVDRLAIALRRLSLDEREALLLVTLEGFDHATAARILRIAKPLLLERLTRARTALSDHLNAPLPTRPPMPTRPPTSTRAPHLRLVVG